MSRPGGEYNLDVMKKSLPLLLLWSVLTVVTAQSPINLRSLRIWPQSRRIEVDGIVNMNEGLIELLATTARGKCHESILVIECNPQLLQASLILIRLNPGDGGSYQGAFLPGDKLYIYVKWRGKDAPMVVRAEDIIWDSKSGRTMPHTPWIFSGSRFGRNAKGQPVFRANVSGSLVATFYDPDAIINNPLPERADDTVYYANAKILPAAKTPVTVVFSAYPLEPK